MFKDQSFFLIKKITDTVDPDGIEVHHKELLFREGEPANYVYFVVRGNFLIKKKVFGAATTEQLFDEKFNP